MKYFKWEFRMSGNDKRPDFLKQKLKDTPHALKKQKLAIDMIKMAKGVITGHESGMYKAASGGTRINEAGGTRGFTLDVLKDKKIQKMIISMTEMYFNKQCKYFTEKTVPHFELWKRMIELLDHSILCMMMMMSQMTVSFHVNMDRSKLDTSSYDNYMKSVKEYLDILFNAEFLLGIIKMLSHECNGGKELGNPDKNGKYFSFEYKTK